MPTPALSTTAFDSALRNVYASQAVDFPRPYRPGQVRTISLAGLDRYDQELLDAWRREPDDSPIMRVLDELERLTFTTSLPITFRTSIDHPAGVIRWVARLTTDQAHYVEFTFDPRHVQSARVNEVRHIATMALRDLFVRYVEDAIRDDRPSDPTPDRVAEMMAATPWIMPIPAPDPTPTPIPDLPLETPAPSRWARICQDCL